MPARTQSLVTSLFCVYVVHASTQELKTYTNVWYFRLINYVLIIDSPHVAFKGHTAPLLSVPNLSVKPPWGHIHAIAYSPPCHKKHPLSMYNILCALYFPSTTNKQFIHSMWITFHKIECWYIPPRKRNHKKKNTWQYFLSRGDIWGIFSQVFKIMNHLSKLSHWMLWLPFSFRTSMYIPKQNNTSTCWVTSLWHIHQEHVYLQTSQSNTYCGDQLTKHKRLYCQDWQPGISKDTMKNSKLL